MQLNLMPYEMVRCSTDEMFMLVSSQRLSHLENTTLAWRESFIQTMVVHTRENNLLVITLVLTIIPLIAFLLFFFFFYRGQISAKKELEPRSPRNALTPSIRGGGPEAEAMGGEKMSFTPSMRWLDLRSVSARGSMKPTTYLCSELVVPSGLDCEFALPNLQAAFVEELFQDTRECLSLPQDILDRKGRPLLRLALTRIAGQSRNSFFEYVLLAKPDASELASCELHVTCEGSNRQTQCSIFFTSGELFARVAETDRDVGNTRERSFLITSANPKEPWTMRVHGDVVNHTVTVASVDTGRRVATLTNPETMSTGGHYLVRLASTTDAALLIIALVAIDRIVALMPVKILSGRPSIVQLEEQK